MIRKFSQHCPEDYKPSRHGSSRSARLQNFLSFVDKKEDELVKRSKRKRKDMLSNSHGKEDESVNRAKRTHIGIS